MAARPVIGMIVPPAAGRVPPEFAALYEGRADFVAVGLGLDRMTPDGYDRVIDGVARHARALAERGAGVVALMGTSLSFYRGPAFNAHLVATIAAAAGLPATTMSNAIVEALGRFGARRIVLGTAYADAVNRRLADFLTSSGFTVTGLAALDIEAVDAVARVTSDDLLDLGRRAHALDPEAEAVLISCGGLRTLDVTARLEADTGTPVISSAVAGAWAAMRLAGADAAAPGHGRLLEPAPQVRDEPQAERLTT